MRNRLPDEVPVIDATDLDDETRHTPALVKNWLKIATTEPAKAGGTDSYGIWSIFSRSNRSLRHPVVFVLIGPSATLGISLAGSNACKPAQLAKIQLWSIVRRIDTPERLFGEIVERPQAIKT